MQLERRQQEVNKRSSRLSAGGLGVGVGTPIAVVLVGYLRRRGYDMGIEEATALGGVITGLLTGAAICYHDIRGMLCSVIYRLWRKR